MAAPLAPGRLGRPGPLRGGRRRRPLPPCSPRCAPGRAPVPGPRPRRRASSGVGCGHCASRRGADAGRVDGEECASGTTGASAPASPAQRARPGNFCGRKAGALRRVGEGKVRRGARGRLGGRLPKAVRTLASRALWCNFAGAASTRAPPQGGGCEAADPRERLCFAALCSALPAPAAPTLRSRPRSGQFEPRRPGGAARSSAGWESAAEGSARTGPWELESSALEANLSPRSSVSPTLAQAPWSPKKKARFSREKSWSKGP